MPLIVRASLVRGTREAIPLFALYALYMADHGLSPGQYATALIVWCVVGLVCEVPSGALADRVDRRVLLAISALLLVGVFVSWLAWPTFAGFLLGFVLWGISEALSSGTFEALLHDELSARGEAGQYARVRSRSEVVAVVAMGVAIASAGPLFDIGGYALLGWISIGAAALHLVTIALLPPASVIEHADQRVAGMTYLETLREGVGEALRRSPVRRAIIAYLAVILVIGADEYLANLLRDNGFDNVDVSYVLAALVAAEALGVFLSERLAHSDQRVLTSVVGPLGAACLCVGALVGGPFVVVGIVLGYALLRAHFMAMDIRIQDAITGRARATVTSVAGFGNNVASLVSFAAYGFVAHRVGWSGAIAVVSAIFLVPVIVTALRVTPRGGGAVSDEVVG